MGSNVLLFITRHSISVLATNLHVINPAGPFIYIFFPIISKHIFGQMFKIYKIKIDEIISIIIDFFYPHYCR